MVVGVGRLHGDGLDLGPDGLRRAASCATRTLVGPWSPNSTGIDMLHEDLKVA
jgi:hypothetical protein